MSRRAAGRTTDVRSVACVLLAACALGACAAQPPVPHAPTARLGAYLIGQYTAGSTAHPGDATRLRIDPVYLEEWDLRTGLFLFASEQRPGEPWRGTLYHLVPRPAGEVVAEVWHPPERRRGTDADPLGLEEIEAIGRAAFRREAGCDLVFHYGEDGIFDGEHTRRGACPVGNGAPADSAYMWLRMRVAPSQMVWFPQYFTGDGELAWTPEPAGYRFEQVRR